MRGGSWVVRWFVFALLGSAGAMAQTSCAAAGDTGPVSGLVLDAANGHPIAGASIHYRGKGGGFDGERHEANSPNLQGETKTSADGSYVIDCLPRGAFNLRVTAQGYFGARDVVARKLAGEKPVAGSLLPSDGVLRLQPDRLDLKAMPSAALARLNRQDGGYSGASLPAPAFTPDGNRIAFLVAGAVALQAIPKEGAQAADGCTALAFDLRNGELRELSGGLPSDYCAAHSTEIAWDGDLVYVHFTDYHASPVKIEAKRLEGGRASPWPVDDLPKTLKEKLERKAANGAADRAAEEQMKAENVEATSDRRFTLKLGEGELAQCNSLVAASTQPKWEQTVATCAFPADRILDRNRDLLFYTEPSLLVEFNFKTKGQRRFALPPSEMGLDLLAYQPLAGGGTRMAYTVVDGDCDPAAADEDQDAPERSGVCFITIPAP